ncbi:MAG TPA: hypothetical protein VE969_09720, partial [Pyrinomonadaceae bacterium]|nr:hypothetical protein [Pyrinomonadaceae bacterium]
MVIAGIALSPVLAQEIQPDRAAQWKGYTLPTAEFRRVVDETHGVILRVPSDWKQEPATRSRAQESSYRFIGPYSTVLQVSIEKIPDGLPLQSYAAQIAQQLRNLPGTADSLSVRQTEMSGLEAREISFDLPDESGMQTRRLIWCAVDGPVAIGVVFIEPPDHISETEPYLRAVIESITIYDKDQLPAFEAARSAAIKEGKPARIDEVQALVAKVNGLDASVRATAIDQLANLFARTPDVGIDLILDRRPIVRAAAVAAITHSKNRTLDPFLLRALHDQESVVAAQAAGSIASLPNVVALMREQTLSWISTELLSRVWPSLDRKTQIQILNEAFAQPPLPQVPVRTSGRSNGSRAVDIQYSDPSAQLGLVSLLVDIPQNDFKLPLSAILKSQSDTLTAAALQVAYARGEMLPYNELYKLISSPSFEVRRLAAKNLGDSTTLTNVGHLEELANVLAGQAPGSVRPATGDKPQPNNEGKAIANELRVSIKKIRLRNSLAVNAEERSKLISDAARDPELVDWIWIRYLSSTENSRTIPSTLSISPLAENAFPKQMTHYVTIPNPSSVVDKLGASLNNIQMDSARAQANLVLILTGMGRALGAQLGAPADGRVFDYSGIKSDAPMSFGSWVANGAPPGVTTAQRKALVLHVADRDRFERSLAFYQRWVGSFSSFPDGVAIGARFLALFPAVFPMAANLTFQDSPRSTNGPILKYDFSGQTSVDGYPVKWFSARSVSNTGIIDNDVAYLAYVGDAAVVTPSLASMRDMLERIADGGATLAQNQQFKASRETGGEAFYFSNLNELFNQPVANDAEIGESGALRISNSSWESSYRLTFNEDGWSKPLVSFKPDELSAPRELLPRSTVAYYFMKIKGREALATWGAAASSAEMKTITDAWAVDFQKEVLPEFDSECGVALLDVPDLAKNSWNEHWVLFFKLKSDRLQRMLDAGQLFKGATVNKIGLLNPGSSPLYVTIRNGFLLASDSHESFALLEQPEKLVASTDFIKAVKRSPAGVVAFGGYNLEATNTFGGANPDSVKVQQANVILSLVRAFHSPSFTA